MTRLSSYLLPTLKDSPADAEALSHKLMVRAGLIRQVGAGIYSWLPAGLRVLRKVEAIIREEMDGIGAQEMLMPVLQPRELWRRSGRDGIPELFRLADRKGTELLLAMTHEENVAYHVAREIRSYRELPQIVYQLQTKERDEPRPRAGILRTREFTMKDAYSLDRDAEGLDRSYELHRGAYRRIYDRCGLDWVEVESDVGMMGGVGAHEYMAPCAAGEDEIALAPGYAANVEVATATAQPVELPPPLDQPREAPTPGLTTVTEVAAALGVAEGALIKAMPVVAEDRGVVMALVRGDHRLNSIKLANHLGSEIRPANADEIAEAIGPVGFVGPVGTKVPVVADAAISGAGWVCGANRADAHLIGVEPGRDFDFEPADIRAVEVGDTTAEGERIRIEPAIEIGNIFKLGTRFSDALGATFLDPDGKEQSVVMGSYGVGPARIAAAAIEQLADERGIVWPRAIAPWQVHLVSLSKGGDEVAEAAEELYRTLGEAGFEVVLDDRPNAGTGEKLTDAELLGCPLRLTVGKRGLAEGNAEAQLRGDGSDHQVRLDQAVHQISRLLGG